MSVSSWFYEIRLLGLMYSDVWIDGAFWTLPMPLFRCQPPSNGRAVVTMAVTTAALTCVVRSERRHMLTIWERLQNKP